MESKVFSHNGRLPESLVEFGFYFSLLQLSSELYTQLVSYLGFLCILLVSAYKSPSVSTLSKTVNIFWTLMLHNFQSPAVVFFTSILSMRKESLEQNNFPVTLILG